MCADHEDWFKGFRFGGPGGGGPRAWAGMWSSAGTRGGRRRGSMFESGEVKFVILRLLREKPSHGYEVIRALEEKFGGLYKPSAGTVYPTLQLLEDEGYVRVVETDGKKVYHVTPEGAQYLDEHRDVLEEIIDRVRETVRDFTGGGAAEVHQAFAHLAGITFKRAWHHRGPDDPALKRVAEILRKAADEIEQALAPKAASGGGGGASGSASSSSSGSTGGGTTV